MSDRSGQRVERCEVCVVGTGAAGGLLAYRLATAGVNVLVLEQGAPIDESYFTNHLRPEQQETFGITEDVPWPISPNHAYFYVNAQAHRLYATHRTSSTSARAEATFVNRQVIRLNGKLNLWGGVALRQSRRDFRGRDFGDSDINWPLGYDDLEAHYAAVERLIGVCGTREGLECLPDGEFYPPKPLRPADRIVVRAVSKIRRATMRAIPNRKAVETRPDRPNVCQDCGDCIYGCHSASVYKFSSHLWPRIQDRPNVRLLCHAKVVRLVRESDGDRIRAAECLDTETRQRFRVEAERFALCAGAFETPRILLNSLDPQFPDGLANSSGTLGRYLQDSMKVLVGSPLVRLLGNREPYAAGFSDNLLIPRFLFDNSDFRGGFQAQVAHFVPKYPYYVHGLSAYPGWSRKSLARLLFHSYLAVIFFGKAEVRRENRLLPSEQHDKYGVPQVDVHFQYTPSDLRMQQSMLTWGQRILRKCSGWFPYSLPDRLPGPGIHYAGTCRMSDSPDQGVVNPDLRCFDHSNLYIGDASVMPDMSEKNLTLTVMALANRLADHLVNCRGSHA
jgi:choline dehydrogenase-like flavoprotein